MKGHITKIAEMYPNGCHWEITILPTRIKISDLSLGWIKLWYVKDPLKLKYNCKIERIEPYNESLRFHIALIAWWSPEIDVDEGDCLTDLTIGNIEFEYNDETNSCDDIFVDASFERELGSDER